LMPRATVKHPRPRSGFHYSNIFLTSGLSFENSTKESQTEE